MNGILKNLTRKTTEKISKCEVVRIVSPNLYRVKDEMNRTTTAESSQVWKVGDFVSVKNNRIIGKAARKRAIPVVNV